MFSIESERLKLIPLTFNQLLLSGHDRVLLDQALNLNPSAMQIDPLFKAEMDEALQNFWLPNTKAYPDLYQWYTNWEVILKSVNTCIGGIGFGGYPDNYGETSVGYMIDRQHHKNGYATEALTTLSKWGFSFSILKAIKADTTPHNLASQRVLIKAGFRLTHSENGLLYYKLQK